MSDLESVVRALAEHAHFGGDTEAQRVVQEWAAEYDEKESADDVSDDDAGTSNDDSVGDDAFL